MLTLRIDGKYGEDASRVIATNMPSFLPITNRFEIFSKMGKK